MLSARQTADMIGVSVSTLYKRWRKWELTAHRIGGQLKFRERNVESWLQAREVR